MANAEINIIIKSTIWLKAAKIFAKIKSKRLLLMIKNKPIAFIITGNGKTPVLLSEIIDFK